MTIPYHSSNFGNWTYLDPLGIVAVVDDLGPGGGALMLLVKWQGAWRVIAYRGIWI